MAICTTSEIKRMFCEQCKLQAMPQLMVNDAIILFQPFVSVETNYGVQRITTNCCIFVSGLITLANELLAYNDLESVLESVIHL